MIDFTALLANPNLQAFLRVIRAGESSQDDSAYTTLFGGGRFLDTSKHPNVTVTANGYTSTAAGAYQFLYRTWSGLVEKYGFPDFSPRSQDCGAIALIAGRGALDDVLAGRFDSAISKCNKEWASLPGSPYGQPTRDLSSLQQVYLSYGGTLAGSTVQPETVTDTPDKPAPVVESKPVYTRKTMEPLSILAMGIQALSTIIPAVKQIFPGNEVSDRNAKAATVLLETAKTAVDAYNTQDLVQKINSDPASHSVIQNALGDLVEVGGGIPEARKATVEMQKAGPLWGNPAFIISLLLLVPVYAVIGSVLGMFGIDPNIWDDNVRMLVVGLISNVTSGIMGFFLGSSFGSQKKTDALTR